MGALLLGCGQGQTSGQVQTTSEMRNFDEDAITALPVGTAQAEVLREFGAPQLTRTSEDGTDVWTYLYTSQAGPVGTNHPRVAEIPLDQRVTQAHTLTTLDHGEGRIKSGQSDLFAEQRATVDQDGNVTVTLEEKTAAKAVNIYFRDWKLVKAKVVFSSADQMQGK